MRDPVRVTAVVAPAAMIAIAVDGTVPRVVGIGERHGSYVIYMLDCDRRDLSGRCGEARITGALG